MRFSHSKEHRGCPEKNQRQLKNTSRSLSGPKKPRVAKKSIHNRWLGGYVGNKCGHQSPDKPYPPVFIDTHNFTKEPHPNQSSDPLAKNGSASTSVTFPSGVILIRLFSGGVTGISSGFATCGNHS
jgi:hypothetical protein